MTTTNRAFIKAYRTDEAQEAPASPAMSAAARTSAPVVSAVSGAAVARTEAGATQPAASRERSALYGPRPIATPHTTGGTTGEKRPLSSFIASTGIARLDTHPADGDFFRPGTTLASFHWPEVCRLLSRRCADRLGKVVDTLIAHSEAGRSLVGFVGMTHGCGTTTITVCLAARLAERGRRVIVVDGNFLRPRMASMLEVEPTAGWQDVLKHGAPLTDAVIRAADDGIDLLALGAKIPNDPKRLVGGLQAVVTAGVLRHAYEHVLIDAGAFSDAKSQPIMLELLRNMGIDAAIAVRVPSSNSRDISALAERVSPSGCEFLGTIENRVALGEPVEIV
jgi:Mrp family chromosome partitioning ATPase